MNFHAPFFSSSSTSLEYSSLEFVVPSRNPIRINSVILVI